MLLCQAETSLGSHGPRTENGPKSKIEIQWSDISAIRATIQDNQPDTLEVEVQHVPQFFKETNPEPRKHTLWHPTVDFTRGQASKFRYSPQQI
ncbi:hypothetical protein ACLOJK_017646 [Asimina triloba]